MHVAYMEAWIGRSAAATHMSRSVTALLSPQLFVDRPTVWISECISVAWQCARQCELAASSSAAAPEVMGSDGICKY